MLGLGGWQNYICKVFVGPISFGKRKNTLKEDKIPRGKSGKQFVYVFFVSEVSKKGWREGVGDQQRPKYSRTSRLELCSPTHKGA